MVIKLDMLAGSQTSIIPMSILLLVGLFVLFTCVLVYVRVLGKPIGFPGGMGNPMGNPGGMGNPMDEGFAEEASEANESKEDVIKEPSRYMLDAIGCVHRQTGFKFSKEVLSRDESVEDGSSCVLNGRAMGLVPLLDGKCDIAFDNPENEWKNLVSAKNCAEDPVCSKVSKQLSTSGLVPKDLVSGKKCAIAFDSNVSLESLKAFDEALMLNAAALGAAEQINRLMVIKRARYQQTVVDRNTIMKLESNVARLEGVVNKLTRECETFEEYNRNYLWSINYLHSYNLYLTWYINHHHNSNVILTDRLKDAVTRNQAWANAIGCKLFEFVDGYGKTKELKRGFHDTDGLMKKFAGFHVYPGFSVKFYDANGNTGGLGSGWYGNLNNYGWRDRITQMVIV
jgi:hypothetical protein